MNKFPSWLYLVLRLLGFAFLFTAMGGLVLVAIYLSYVPFNEQFLDTTKNDLRKVDKIKNDKTDQSLIAEYPARVLYDATPQEIRITRLATVAAADALTLTITLDESLILSETTYVTKTGSILTLTSTVATPLTPTIGSSVTIMGIPITANMGAATASTTRLISDVFTKEVAVLNYQFVFSPTQAISFHIYNARIIEDDSLPTKTVIIQASNFADSLNLVTEVEGAKRSAKRVFIGSAITENGSLLILLSTLASFIAFGLNQFQQQERDRQQREDQEREREEVREEAKRKENRKREVDTQFTKVRQALIRANPADARQEYSKIRPEDLKGFLPSVHVDWMEKYLQIAVGNASNLNLEYFVKNAPWVEETLGTLTALASLPGVKERRNLYHAIAIFLLEKQNQIPDQQRQELKNMTSGWEEISNRLRSAPWKSKRPRPQRLPTETKLGEILEYAPFGPEAAEDDLDFLFGDAGGFWGDHPLYHQIATSNNPEVIFGETGCGKTALAHALVEASHPSGIRSNILPLYISGQPEIKRIHQEITRTLLNFICASPFTLASLGNTECDLLARQLCAGLDYDFVKAKLNMVKSVPISDALEPEQKERWRVERDFQLDNFQGFLKKYRLTAWSPLLDWLRLTEISIQILGFDFALVSLDLDSEKTDYVREILPLLRPWSHHNLVIKLFLLPSVARKMRRFSNLGFWSLTWTNDQIEALIRWRIKTVSILTRTPAESFFDDDFYAKFSVQRNPRCLAQLWQYLFEDYHRRNPNDIRFSAENLAWAVQQSKHPT
ncbi:MAG: hypothetical protein BroJett011_70770 [Chloroflexota bacterium]|nr:MAG: hypothetical protein BroJett011_70770 [Chloroflexota bacterium]